MLQAPVLALLGSVSSACVLLSRCSMQAVLAGSGIWHSARQDVDPTDFRPKRRVVAEACCLCMQQGTLERADGGAKALTALTSPDC